MFPKQGRAVILIRIQEVNQMMGDKFPLCGRRLGGADIHPAVDLHRIGAEDLPLKPSREAKSQRGFSGGGGPDNGYEAGQIRHKIA